MIKKEPDANFGLPRRMDIAAGLSWNHANLLEDWSQNLIYRLPKFAEAIE
jgi:hypothetical protein